jgi:hypothetical protein
MFKDRPRILSPRTLGLFFLIPGLLWGIPASLTGAFVGATMGFCVFAVTFGLILVFIPYPLRRVSRPNASQPNTWLFPVS